MVNIRWWSFGNISISENNCYNVWSIHFTKDNEKILHDENTLITRIIQRFVQGLCRSFKFKIRTFSYTETSNDYTQWITNWYEKLRLTDNDFSTGK